MLKVMGKYNSTVKTGSKPKKEKKSTVKLTFFKDLKNLFKW
jgi:hypothetical protein